MNINISKASFNDIESMSKLLNELLSHEADFTPNEKLQKQGLKLILNSPQTGQLFVAKLNNRVVGMVNLLFTVSTAIGQKVAILEDMVVFPEFRNSGVGGQLIKHAKFFAQQEGFGRITLLTDNDNNKAHAFYHKYGFSKSAMVAFRYLP